MKLVTVSLVTVLEVLMTLQIVDNSMERKWSGFQCGLYMRLLYIFSKVLALFSKLLFS